MRKIKRGEKNEKAASNAAFGLMNRIVGAA